MRPLALHQLTAVEAGPVGLVSIAEAIGCEQVCLFVHAPRAGREGGADGFPTVTRALTRELKARLDGCGISVSNVDFFPLGRDVMVDDHRAALWPPSAGRAGSGAGAARRRGRPPADRPGRSGRTSATGGLTMQDERGVP